MRCRRIPTMLPTISLLLLCVGLSQAQFYPWAGYYSFPSIPPLSGGSWSLSPVTPGMFFFTYLFADKPATFSASFLVTSLLDEGVMVLCPWDASALLGSEAISAPPCDPVFWQALGCLPPAHSSSPENATQGNASIPDHLLPFRSTLFVFRCSAGDGGNLSSVFDFELHDVSYSQGASHRVLDPTQQPLPWIFGTLCVALTFFFVCFVVHVPRFQQESPSKQEYFRTSFYACVILAIFHLLFATIVWICQSFDPTSAFSPIWGISLFIKTLAMILSFYALVVQFADYFPDCVEPFPCRDIYIYCPPCCLHLGFPFGLPLFGTLCAASFLLFFISILALIPMSGLLVWIDLWLIQIPFHVSSDSNSPILILMLLICWLPVTLIASLAVACGYYRSFCHSNVPPSGHSAETTLGSVARVHLVITAIIIWPYFATFILPLIAPEFCWRFSWVEPLISFLPMVAIPFGVFWHHSLHLPPVLDQRRGNVNSVDQQESASGSDEEPASSSLIATEGDIMEDTRDDIDCLSEEYSDGGSFISHGP